MVEKTLKLGEDLTLKDNVVTGVTFEELINAVRYNCKEITPFTVIEELVKLIEYRTQIAGALMSFNMDTIIQEAMNGRDQR